MGEKKVEIRRVTGGPDLDAFRDMAREYAVWLNVDLCFQDFDAEMAGLPGKYAEPAGCILVAAVDGVPAGCVALAPLQANAVCEMKRLWVRPGNRGLGLGRKLAVSIMEAGFAAGYREMRLDTLPHLQTAIAIYRDLGFNEISAYYHNPLDGVLYMGRSLP
ncbi:MAG: GNAT family N-acetyltransferase [Rhodospirillales bacterium]